MKRGPYKQYLLPGSSKPVPNSLKKRRGITDDDLNQTREEEVAMYYSSASVTTTELQENNRDENIVAYDIQDIQTDVIEPSGDDDDEDLMNHSYSDTASESSDSESSNEFQDMQNEAGSGNEGNEDNGNETDDETDTFNNPDQFKALNEFLQKNSKNLNLNININPADVIILILTLAVVHDFTLTAVTDVLKVINLICCCNVFPSTRYLFKKLFNPSIGTSIHLVCEKCRHYLGKQGTAGIERCSNCNLVNDIAGYKYEYAFVTLDIKSQLLDILENKKCKFNFHTSPNITKFTDINCGSMYRNFVPLVEPDSAVQYISFSFNVDGTPISKDSKTSITPIYLTINELDLVSRRKHLILAGVWYGRVKPRNDVFLKPFTETFNALRTEGVKLRVNNQVKIFKMLTLCCCVDTIARSPLQGVVGVNGYYCCSWCELKGSIERNTVKYNFVSPAAPERTEESFRDCYLKFANGSSSLESKGVVSVTPLVNLISFSMIWGFTPDYLHCVLLGVTKRFLGLWFNEKANNEHYIGAPSKILAIDSLLAKIKIPQCLKRIPVSLKKRKVMKGRELENWLLYYSIPAITGILKDKFITHWKLLVCGISLLLQDEITMADINEAELKLVEFVYFVDELYNDFEMTYNVHQLLHLAESCRRWGPLWSHTTFPYESSLRKAKRILKASRGVPQQIIRSLEMNRALEFVIRNHNCSEEVLTECKNMKSMKLATSYMHFTDQTFLSYIGEFLMPDVPIPGLPDNMRYSEYEKLVKDSIVYRKASEKNRKTDDSYVRLNDCTFARIYHILCLRETGECYLIIKKIECHDEDGLCFTKKFTDFGTKMAISFKEIHSVAIRITVDRTHDYISSIPRKHYILNL